MRDIVTSVVLGIIEGLTEFIPVSSTGHLIIASDILGFEGARADTFDVVIQVGAILAVVVLYRQRLRALCTLRVTPGFTGRRGLLLLGLTSMPALLLGALTHSAIKEHLFNPLTVAVGLGVGGAAMIVVERVRPQPRWSGLDALDWRRALAIGAFQCVALWPGTSRSAATIVGAMLLGVDRETAAEYSFLAAIPVLGTAAVFDLFENRRLFAVGDLPMFAVGLSVAFLCAWLAIRFFIHLLSRVTLEPFGWYRMIVAVVLLGFFTV